MQTFIYKIIPKKRRIVSEVEFDVVWHTIQVGKEKLNLIEIPKYEPTNKALLEVFVYLGTVLVASSNTG